MFLPISKVFGVVDNLMVFLFKQWIVNMVKILTALDFFIRATPKDIQDGWAFFTHHATIALVKNMAYHSKKAV